VSKTSHELTVGRFLTLLLLFVAVSLAVAAACVFVGPYSMAPGDVLRLLAGARPSGSETELSILLNLRVPRVMMAFIAGGALAVAGAVFQVLLRNPLATSDTLGVSAGGALGAVVAMALGWTHVRLGVFGPVQIFALIGSLGAIGFIYALARQKEHVSTMKLLLAGVTLALFCSAAIMLVRYIADPYKLVEMDRWLMGGLDVQGYRGLASVIPLFLPALVLLLSQANELNQLAFGEELAAGRGIDVRAVQIASFVGGSVITASVVSVAGPIGFVGLIVPHVFRLIFGPDHRVLLPASLFGGGVFLVVADTFARTMFAPSELPVGVLTAMLGGPFFLILLVRKSKL